MDIKARRPGSQTRTRVTVVERGGVKARNDKLATEEPLEVRLVDGAIRQTVTVTMRTPGADFDLAAGMLFSEGVVRQRDEIDRMEYCVDDELDPTQRYNIITAYLRPRADRDLSGITRSMAATSACGVCGKASLDQIEPRLCAAPILSDLAVSREVIFALPERLQARQSVFAQTGGLHAAALFDRDGKLIAAREDVGRHNAVDKLIGWAMLDGRAPLSDSVLMVSGRIGFEIAQKAANAGTPILAAVSAPSSLAVDLANRFGLTLIGFLRGERFNIYAHPKRILRED
jgi:FdhD protein